MFIECTGKNGRKAAFNIDNGPIEVIEECIDCTIIRRRGQVGDKQWHEIAEMYNEIKALLENIGQQFYNVQTYRSTLKRDEPKG